MQKHKKIAFIGTVCLDIIVKNKCYPIEDSQQRCTEIRKQAGGNGGNSAKIFSKIMNTFSDSNGIIQTEFIGTIIKTEESQIIKKEFEESQVIYNDNCQFQEGATVPTSVILINESNGSRTILHHNQYSQDFYEISFEHFSNIKITEFDWIHFEGRNCLEMKKMMIYCRKNNPNCKVSLEIERVKPNIEDLIEYADIVFIGKDFVLSKGIINLNNDFPCLLKQLQLSVVGKQLIIFPQGSEKNVLIYDTQSNKMSEIQPFQLPKDQIFIETLGAGDSFIAGTLYGLINNLKNEDAVKFGCAIAAEKCKAKSWKEMEIDKLKYLI